MKKQFLLIIINRIVIAMLRPLLKNISDGLTSKFDQRTLDGSSAP